MGMADDFGTAETPGLLFNMDVSPIPAPRTKEEWLGAHDIIMSSNQRYLTEMFEIYGEVTPRFVGVGAKDGRLFLCTMAPNRLSKNETVFAVRRIARREKLFTLYHFDEAWFVSEENNTPASHSAAQLAYEQRLYEHPKREECLLIGVDSKVEGVVTGMWQAMIERPSRGKARLGPWHNKYTGPDARLEGRFMYMLHEPPTEAQA